MTWLVIAGLVWLAVALLLLVVAIREAHKLTHELQRVSRRTPQINPEPATGPWFEIRQQVRTTKQRWLEVVERETHERLARQEYARLKDANPDEYLELVKIDRTETCLAFTPKFD